jgi:HD superfamily phosphohydrolase
MPKGRTQRIQDSVHGLMEFMGVEGVIVELLRTPELQRLRRIKQLGLADYVFPGAEHSRLAHSLGAAHLAVRFTRRLQEVAQEIFAPALCLDELAVRDMAVAAVCHDLGHGPFSHAWEREIIGENFNRTAWARTLGLEGGEWCDNLKWHELVGHGLLGWGEGKLCRLLEAVS